jgi:hypothetical protein
MATLTLKDDLNLITAIVMHLQLLAISSTPRRWTGWGARQSFAMMVASFR